MSDHLDDLRERVQAAEERITEAQSAIQRLEDKSRWLRTRSAGLVAVGLAVLAAVVSLAASPPAEDTVQAPFKVVDEKGQPIFVVQEDHSFGLYRAGRDHPALLGSTGGPIEFKAQSDDTQTTAAIGIADGPGNAPAVDLRYKGSTKRLNMFVVAGRPSIILTKANAVPMGAIGQRGGTFQDNFSESAGSMHLYDATGGLKVLAGTTSTGVGAVAVHSERVAPGAHFRIPNTFICGGGCSGRK
jgi:hypothetical protein